MVKLIWNGQTQKIFTMKIITRSQKITREDYMSDHRNQIILESLYQKYLDLGHEDAEALELAAKEFEENSN